MYLGIKPIYINYEINLLMNKDRDTYSKKEVKYLQVITISKRFNWKVDNKFVKKQMVTILKEAHLKNRKQIKLINNKRMYHSRNILVVQ